MRTISVHIQPYFPLPGKSFSEPREGVSTHTTCADAPNHHPPTFSVPKSTLLSGDGRTTSDVRSPLSPGTTHSSQPISLRSKLKQMYYFWASVYECRPAGPARQPRETSESNAIISLIRQSGPRMRVLVYIIYKYIFRCVETRAFHCRPVGCIIFHAAQRPDIASNGIFIPSRVHHHHVCVCVRVRTRARRARVCFLFRRLKQSHIRNACAYFYCAYVIYVLCPLLRRVRREFFVMG